MSGPVMIKLQLQCPRIIADAYPEPRALEEMLIGMALWETVAGTGRWRLDADTGGLLVEYEYGLPLPVQEGR